MLDVTFVDVDGMTYLGRSIQTLPYPSEDSSQNPHACRQSSQVGISLLGFEDPALEYPVCLKPQAMPTSLSRCPRPPRCLIRYATFSISQVGAVGLVAVFDTFSLQ